MIRATDLSLAEKCYRLPQLIWQGQEPIRIPVREAAKRAFYEGLRYLSSSDAVEQGVDGFLTEAAGRGYEYPADCDVYTLARDFGSWLDGALRIVLEQQLGTRRVKPVMVGTDMIDLGAISGADRTAHFFHVSSRLDYKGLRWPELLLIACGSSMNVSVHKINLPQVSKGRLQSPLCLSYKHPMISDQYRLAPVWSRSEGRFNGKWKRVGRWEIDGMSWQEWRVGIDRDQCLNQIYQRYDLQPEDFLRPDQVDSVLRDAEMTLDALKSELAPRKQEACRDCLMRTSCHP